MASGQGGGGRSFLAARTQRAVANRRAFPYLTFLTLVLGLLAGFVVRLVDKQDFPTFGHGVCWAIVTLGTVGYGDIVPTTAWGRLTGSLVIVVGVTFYRLSDSDGYLAFVSAEEQQARERERQRNEAAEEETREMLRGLKAQTDAIEATLDRRL
jgi:voltage-gated potassium channel